MPIVGFNFDKIEVERIKNITTKLEIKNSLGIKDITTEKLPISNIEEVLKFSFEFNLNYEPGVGKILLQGHILYTDEPKKIKDIQKEWKKDKKIDSKLLEIMINTILQKCHLKSLMLAQEVNLPLHMNLPSIQATKTDKNYIG
jgi:hypothetical protein